MADNNIGVYLYTLRLKGYLAYEYNPFRNYLTDVDLYEVDTDVGKTLIPKGCAVNKKNGLILYTKTTNNIWIDKNGISVDSNNVKTTSDGSIKAKAGSLIDLDTDQLNFDLNHPVDIEVQPSYDGSVNLIINDDKNIPRIINSRFSAREKNTYEIVDRIGENDTNIYNSKTFDKDTSLYFQYEYNPKIKYMGFVKGVLPVGLYCFYFTYCDADDNESDYIAETGVIPLFIGSDSDSASIDGGIKNQLSNKGVKLKLTNLDKSYNYLKVYYVRYFADYLLNRVYECKKIYKRYPINSSILYLQINGYEDTEDLDPNILNISRFNPKHLLTQAQCKNMLFFGNIVKNSDNYKELQDCALRITPSVEPQTIDLVDQNYVGTGYYSSLNMYNNVGYFNDEFYRFGVVFIYLNGTLSNVYNILGGDISIVSNKSDNNSETEENKSDNNPKIIGDLFSVENAVAVRNYITIDDSGWVKSDSNTTITGTNLNARGVCRIRVSGEEANSIYGIKFNIPDDVKEFLNNDLGIRGLFFVRQKRIPNLLAQCYILPMDELLEAPVLFTENDKKEDEFFTECFLSQGENNTEGRILYNEYESRLYHYKHTDDGENAISKTSFAGICPDFVLNQPYFNLIFNGATFRLKKAKNKSVPDKNGRFYNIKDDESLENSPLIQAKICTVTDNVPTVAIKDKIYRLEIGETEEAYRFKYAEVDNGTYNAGDDDFDSISESTNLVRGKYSPYLAIYSESGIEYGCLYNIYQDNVINSIQEYLNRMDSSDAFYSISDRYNFGEFNNSLVCYRGDCYLNLYTHRLNRNFNDPSLPNNDEIIDKNTWKENYIVLELERWADISRSDVNAVQMGSWITFNVRSSYNYALRSEDHSFVAEEALMGAPRSFFPRSRLLWRGENKMPDSCLYNDAYRATLGFKCYFTLQDINYVKNTFSNRILYSAISIQDSFKNNYRYSLSTYFRDYSQEYGSILKLVGFEGYLLVIFEHAIGVAVINERVLAGNGDGEPVFINTSNVLPEELTIISDTYGSQWPESVIKSEAGYVYGVDTIAKKIWRVKGQQLEILSDFKVNKFLIDNITLGERELYPIVGLKNVKTHYNNNKKDIMFTFYDDVYKDEEKIWNLCYNELLNEFVTFYSWIPSYSENIDTQFFTFDRNTSKALSLLGKCSYSIPENYGVLVDSPILLGNGNYSFSLYYSGIDRNIRVPYTVVNEDGTTYIREETVIGTNTNGLYILPNVKFRFEKDHWGNWKYVINENESGNITLTNVVTYEQNDDGEYKLVVENGEYKYELIDENEQVENENRYNKRINSIDNLFKARKVLLFEVTPYLESSTTSLEVQGTTEATCFSTETIAITLDSIVNNPLITEVDKSKPALTTDFYLHGQAGIFNVVENLYPTYWYGEQHPFEFEFVVNDKVAQQKIFNNLIIISNKAEPESFHFEIEGDNYEFSSDKRNMYFRLEATKQTYLNLGSDILYDRYYTDVAANKYTLELHYRSNSNDYTNQYSKMDRVYPVTKSNLVLQVKSTIFPLYYQRIDTYNEIYHDYTQMLGNKYDYKNLSGSEIKWNRDLNLFNIVTHIKNSPVDLVGRLRGNSRYKEGTWNIQIPSITFMLKNEEPWKDKIPTIVLSGIPDDILKSELTGDDLPNTYDIGQVSTDKWTYRKETYLRDKWIKVRVRYSGKNLAIIHSLITLYNISYS